MEATFQRANHSSQEYSDAGLTTNRNAEENAGGSTSADFATAKKLAMWDGYTPVVAWFIPGNGSGLEIESGELTEVNLVAAPSTASSLHTEFDITCFHNNSTVDNRCPLKPLLCNSINFSHRHFLAGRNLILAEEN